LSSIEKKLFLKVNLEKSTEVYITKAKFLGQSFCKKKWETRLRINLKSVEKMRTRIRVLTTRSNGWGNARRKEALNQYITGWVNYFKLADMQNLLVKTDECYRRRLRMVF
jgi:RNA-directed DNA polymerase